MKKLIIAVTSSLMIILLSGCEAFNSEPNKRAGGEGYSIICLSGIEYYKYYDTAGYDGYFGLAPVVDSETKEFKSCNTSLPITHSH